MADPLIDYTARDYQMAKTALLEYARQVFPEWTSRSEGDFGVLMTELFSYITDLLSYNCDRAAMEAFLPTATQRMSVLAIADMLGYLPHNGAPAQGAVWVKTEDDAPAAVILKAGTQFAAELDIESDEVIIFESDADVTIPADHSPTEIKVTQGETVRDQLVGTSTGEAGQRFRLPRTGVLHDTVKIEVVEAYGPSPWARVDHIVDADPSDKAFTVRTDSNGVTWVRFGDGITGAIPSRDQQIRATFRVADGIKGNLDSGKIVMIASENIYGVELAPDGGGQPRSTEMRGGADPESTESIRGTAPLQYRTQDRCVSIDDYKQEALSVPGVVKATAIAEHFSSVNVFVAGPGGSSPNARMIERIYEHLRGRIQAGITVSVAGPKLVPIDVGVTLWLEPRTDVAHAKFRAKEAVSRLLSPDRTEFGMCISVSAIVAELMRLEGVYSARVTKLMRKGGTDKNPELRDLGLRPIELPTAGTINVAVGDRTTICK